MSEIEVTAADREAAADFIRYWTSVPEIKEDYPSSTDSVWVRDGKGDDEPLVQAFAAHRLATEQASDKLAAKRLRELGEIAWRDDWDGPFTARHAADAIERGEHRRK